MSAFVVSKAHVDALVQSLIVNDLATFETADDLGKNIWQENVDAFNDYYSNRYSDECPDVDSYKFTGIEAPLHPALVVRQVCCYRYQCCTLDGFEGRAANQLLEQLATKLSGVSGDDPQYDWQEAVVKSMNLVHPPWAIDSIEELVVQSGTKEETLHVAPNCVVH